MPTKVGCPSTSWKQSSPTYGNISSIHTKHWRLDANAILIKKWAMAAISSFHRRSHIWILFYFLQQKNAVAALRWWGGQRDCSFSHFFWWKTQSENETKMRAWNCGGLANIYWLLSSARTPERQDLFWAHISQYQSKRFINKKRTYKQIQT